MKHIIYIWTLLISALFCAPKTFAQDLHFSQFFNSPLTTNPANTGFIPDGDYRLGINYRDQWSSVMSVPYKTMSAFGDVQLMKNKFDNGWIGLGGVILRDVAGSGNLTSTKLYGSVAYHQLLGYSSLLSLGFNVGMSNKQINVSNLKFPDQFDGKFFDNKLPTTVLLDKTNVSYLDMQVGMNYAYFPTPSIYVNTGFSVHHVNRPHESFFSSEATGVDNRVPMRYIGFLNGSFKLNDEVIINPNIYYTRQANVSELVGGLNAHYNLSGDGEYLLIAGAYYRHKEAIIPLVGLGFKDYTFTFTYDATISSLKNFNNSRGAFEFSLIRQGIISPGGQKVTPCPTFKTY
ncbi:PorP/SprF family type IX secretion system membrane protein [Flavisolibacter ginsengisoli]|jgi:type IX secretion system PorP/SprF family membrane protein|uniref:Type IX secretion system membrane protein, PorP/SprF family n=1 Tax=Flavisolibacter ginsengisoli DSM 18119 TaxID=1121884 RepID=A0A1M5EYA2_9BACT|nr:PorP/SprF family type IX secretion system membrane protein [Flavisolibacter ginsengisoli]SHF84178.1 type IX secretion system membrane protein, PorP/SprF family [Flavisolibacter ginsengisoli DSM 18119]